ncbi:hypothetical protein [Paenibacillus apii]|uniref:hypothetical protein n=1 Tax=Paenibacillus apii TaxID=1850370 RepID=UPI002E2E7E19|nr:hypothetical protein [Paenibacillus apii]
MEIGRKIYFDKITGNVLQDIGQRSGEVVETTQEQDFEVYQILKERIQETVGVIQLDYNQYIEDFGQCTGYRVNTETLELEFSYPDPNQEETQTPVFQKALSVRVAELNEELTNTQLALADTYEQLQSSQEETTNTQIALVDIYEQLLALQGGN